ncbi:hypothetical protein, partial [Streptomyces sioyaensis]|uniref:hypothetical protein n=1 Tax=Streptomyces sioyaensis TaxID=67364 RepID=UPI001F488BD6
LVEVLRVVRTPFMHYFALTGGDMTNDAQSVPLAPVVAYARISADLAKDGHEVDIGLLWAGQETARVAASLRAPISRPTAAPAQSRYADLGDQYCDR